MQTFQGTTPTPQPEGQPVVPAPSVEQGAEVQPVTMDILDKKLEAIRREMQSLNGKTEARISKKAREQLEAFQQSWQAQAAAGAPVPPEVQERVKQQVITQDLTSPEPEKSATPAAQPAKPDDPTPIDAKAMEIMQIIGAVIEDDDPEVSMIDQSSPQAYLDSVRVAAQAKFLRTSAQKTNPAAQLPGLTGGGTAPRDVPLGSGSALIAQHQWKPTHR